MTRSKPNSNEPNKPTFLDCAPLESSTPLEVSAPLDYGDEIKSVTPASATAKLSPVNPGIANIDVVKRTTLQVEQDEMRQRAVVNQLAVEPDFDHQSPAYRQKRSLSTPTIVEEERVQLLEERLVVDRKKRKVGEIIVRKVIETHIVEVPVRREKLLIEQIGPEPRQLASIDLGQPPTDAVETQGSDSSAQLAVNGEFTSIKAASQFLATIASSQPNPGSQSVQVRILVDHAEQQQLYQQWLNHYLHINNG